MVLRFNSFSATAITLVMLLCVQRVVTSPGKCPHVINDEIQQCVQPVAEYAKVLNHQQDPSSSQSTPNSDFGQSIQIGLPKIGGQVFKELCRLIRDFETCVEGFREKCQKHITINLISSSYGFLCNEGYDTFMKSADCLMELDQRPSVKRCHDDTLQRIERANNEISIPMPMKLESMCSALNSFSSCVMTPISQNCGVEAWKVIFRVLKDTTKTLMPACHFPEQAFPKSTTPTEELVGSSEWPHPKNNNTRIDSSGKPWQSGSSRSGTERARHRPKNSHTTLDYLIENQQFDDRHKLVKSQSSQGNTRRNQKEPNGSRKIVYAYLNHLIIAISFALFIIM